MNTSKFEERRDFIIKFLRENEHLDHESAATALTIAGYKCVGRTIADYRGKYKIDHINRHEFRVKLKHDLERGMTFSTSRDLVDRYGMSISYARRLIKIINKTKTMNVTRMRKPEAPERVELEPVPIGSPAFYIQQLTANDNGKRVE